MQIAMIGLGRMGANMVQRLLKDGHEVVAYDVKAEAVAASVALGAVGATSLADLAAKLSLPRAVWIMVPAAFVDATIDNLTAVLDPGDTIIDGGNSFYRDDIDRSKVLAEKGFTYLDVGTSGGVFGLERGYCLMVGGEKGHVDRLAPIFDTLAPGIEAAPRTAGRVGEIAPAENGWLHCGPSGAGHFVKMVHNGIEYGLMAAYSEGLNILRHAGIGSATHAADAETAPLKDPQYYQFDFDIAAVTELWRRGSVVSSWLLDLTAQALHANPTLDGFAGRVSDSGEGRWTLHAAIDEGVPTPVLGAALNERFSSQGSALYANQVLSAMRKGFGGHDEKKAEPKA